MCECACVRVCARVCVCVRYPHQVLPEWRLEVVTEDASSAVDNVTEGSPTVASRAVLMGM